MVTVIDERFTKSPLNGSFCDHGTVHVCVCMSVREKVRKVRERERGERESERERPVSPHSTYAGSAFSSFGHSRLGPMTMAMLLVLILVRSA